MKIVEPWPYKRECGPQILGAAIRDMRFRKILNFLYISPAGLPASGSFWLAKLAGQPLMLR